MSHGRTSGLLGVLFVLIIALLCSLSGCAATPSQSWDQANLKRADHGCPTAIYVAPEGTIKQCDQADVPFTIVVQHAPPGFDTLEQAAIAGLKAVAAKPTAPYYEWGGEIVQTADGKFSALDANTNFEGDHVGIQGDDFGLNGTVVASYHTHPCLPEHYVEYFSPPDLIEPIFFRRTAFMGDLCTGNVHEFKPGDRPDVENPHAGDSRGLYLTKGRIIGRFTTPHAVTAAE